MLRKAKKVYNFGCTGRCRSGVISDSNAHKDVFFRFNVQFLCLAAPVSLMLARQAKLGASYRVQVSIG